MPGNLRSIWRYVLSCRGVASRKGHWNPVMLPPLERPRRRHFSPKGFAETVQSTREDPFPCTPARGACCRRVVALHGYGGRQKTPLGHEVHTAGCSRRYSTHPGRRSTHQLFERNCGNAVPSEGGVAGDFSGSSARSASTAGTSCDWAAGDDLPAVAQLQAGLGQKLRQAAPPRIRRNDRTLDSARPSGCPFRGNSSRRAGSWPGCLALASSQQEAAVRTSRGRIPRSNAGAPRPADSALPVSVGSA